MKLVFVKFNLFEFNAISPLIFIFRYSNDHGFIYGISYYGNKVLQMVGPFNNKLILLINFYMCLVDFTIVRKRISDKLFGCLLSLVLLLFSHVIFFIFVIVNVLYIRGLYFDHTIYRTK